MRGGGIFQVSGLGSAQLPALNLMPTSKGGGPNPLAFALQSTLKNVGYTNVAVDGNWGQCSQAAFKNFYQDIPANKREDVDYLVGLKQYGVDVNSVPMWTDMGSGCAVKYNPPPADKIFKHPSVEFGERLGMTANQACEKLNGSGSVYNAGTGACEGKLLQLKAATQLTKPQMTTASALLLNRPSSSVQNLKFVETPASGSGLNPFNFGASSSSSPGSGGTVLDRVSTAIFGGGQAGTGAGAGTGTGMSTGAKVVVGVVAVAVGVGGYMLLRKK